MREALRSLLNLSHMAQTHSSRDEQSEERDLGGRTSSDSTGLWRPCWVMFILFISLSCLSIGRDTPYNPRLGPSRDFNDLPSSSHANPDEVENDIFDHVDVYI